MDLSVSLSVDKIGFTGAILFDFDACISFICLE